MKLLSFATICAILLLVVLMVGCPRVVNNARDTIAAANGVIVQAEIQYSPTCTSNPSQPICNTINRAVAAQNAAITALEAYCGFNSASNPNDKCQPVKTLEPALTSALANLNQFVTELKGATK